VLIALFTALTITILGANHMSNSENSKFVLLVEDDSITQQALARLFQSRGVECRIVDTLAEAMKYLAQVDQIRLIVWDGDLFGENSFDDAIQAFKKVFDGPMVAASGNKQSVDKQMEAGCTHRGLKGREQLTVLKQLLL